MIAWADGAFAAGDAPVFAATDRGAILGDGVFETVKTVDATPVFLDAHLARMGEAARALDLALDKGVVRAGVAEVLTRAKGLGALRLTVTRGSGGRGLAPIPLADQRPRVVVTWAPMPPPGDAPVRLFVSSVRRNPSAPSCRHKTLSYADAAFARAEAARMGADDAVMRGPRGDAACASIGNLWARTKDAFVTPPLSAGVLPGIVRQMLLRAGEAGGLPVRVGRIGPDALHRWPLYRSNSLTGVQRCWLPGGVRPPPDNPLGALYAALEAEALR